MELLRQFDFDMLGQIAQQTRSIGKHDRFLALFEYYMDTDDGGQPGWMSVVDGYYRNAFAAVEAGDLYNRDFFLNEAWQIMLARNAVM